MVDENYKNSMSEVLDVLSHSKRDIIIKIPDNVLNYLLENASKTYESKLDHTKNIKDMGLSKKAEDFLSIIYRNYLCDENKKLEYDHILKENEIIYEKELREKYNPDIIFKNNLNNNNNNNNDINSSKELYINGKTSSDENLALIEKKDNIITKILNKIKNILKLK